MRPEKFGTPSIVVTCLMDFPAARQFVPRYSTPAALTTYAIIGGIPAYLERFNDSQSVERNVRARVLALTSMFQIDPLYLLNEALREPRHYFAVLEAIGLGHRTLTEIAQAAGLERTNVPRYLNTLCSLGIVERRLPLEPGRRSPQQRGIYFISDHYLRFYFRFIVPHQSDLQRGEVDQVWNIIEQQLPAFVGSTVFEELCRTWVQTQGAHGNLPFRPTKVGSYWDRHIQVDVVAVGDSEQALLLGEARYTSRPLGSRVLTELGDKAAKLTPSGWQAYLVLFSRSGFTTGMKEQADRKEYFSSTWIWSQHKTLTIIPDKTPLFRIFSIPRGGFALPVGHAVPNRRDVIRLIILKSVVISDNRSNLPETKLIENMVLQDFPCKCSEGIAKSPYIVVTRADYATKYGSDLAIRAELHGKSQRAENICSGISRYHSK